MNCHEVQTLVPEWLRGELESSEADDVRRHIEDCPDCARWAAEVRGLSEGLRQLAPVHPARVAAVAARVLAGAHAVGARRPSGRRRFPRPLAWTALAAAAILLVVTGWFLLVPPPIARVATVQGGVEVRRAGGAWAPAGAGTTLRDRDELHTRGGRAALAFPSGSLAVLGDGAVVRVIERAGRPELEALTGEIYCEVAKADAGFAVETPHGRVRDLGTRFGVAVGVAGTTVAVAEGSVEASTKAGRVTLARNQQAALTGRDAAPGPVASIEDADARFAWARALRPEAAAWHSWAIEILDGPAHAAVRDARGGREARIEFFTAEIREGQIAAVEKLPRRFPAGASPAVFRDYPWNRIGPFWGADLDKDPYPYAGKSAVPRGSDPGESDAPAPRGVLDLQMHPPETLPLVAAAFTAPVAGRYRVVDLAARKIEPRDGPAKLVVFDAGGRPAREIAVQPDRRWVRDPAPVDLGRLEAGRRIVFAVDRVDNFSFDGVEVSWTILAE